MNLKEIAVGQRLSEFMKYKRISQAKMAEALGTGQSAISAAIRGTRQITTGMTARIQAIHPELNIEWLKTGEGEMIREETPSPEISYTDGVPYYDEDFLLGFSEIIASGSERPQYLIRMPGYENATLWCNASGHSMEPEINHGDIIALQRIEDFSFLPFGDLYGIITTNGMRTIKRLGRSQTPGCYRLIPTNPEYDHQDIPINKIAVVYRVLGAMKQF